VASNARGKGVMCAIELKDGVMRDAVCGTSYELGMVVLSCGTSSIRFRPPLDVMTGEIDEALAMLRKAIDQVTPGT
jgi:L-lysine 6-transaminase